MISHCKPAYPVKGASLTSRHHITAVSPGALVGRSQSRQEPRIACVIRDNLASASSHVIRAGTRQQLDMRDQDHTSMTLVVVLRTQSYTKYNPQEPQTPIMVSNTSSQCPAYRLDADRGPDTSFHAPPSIAQHADQNVSSQSSSPWEVRMSNSRQMPYFYNAQTNESSWTVPAGFNSEAELMTLKGANEYLGPHLQQQQQQGQRQSGGRDGQVRASHLLIKHAGSRRPASWKSVSEGLTRPTTPTHRLLPRQQNITLPKDQAIQQLRKHLEHLRSVPSSDLPRAFAELANAESDCSSHAKGGDLGWFGRGQMQRPFEVRSLALYRITRGTDYELKQLVYRKRPTPSSPAR